jgi:mucus binding protein (fragment)
LGEVKFKDEDGNIVKTEQNENKVDGRDGDEYTTEKNEKDGFKFVKTQDPKDNPTYSTDGKSTTGKIVGNKDQSITYVYEKVVKKEKPTPCPVCPTPKPEPEPKPEQKKLPQSGSSEEGYALGMAMLGLSGLMTIVDIKRKNEK